MWVNFKPATNTGKVSLKADIVGSGLAPETMNDSGTIEIVTQGYRIMIIETLQ